MWCLQIMPSAGAFPFPMPLFSAHSQRAEDATWQNSSRLGSRLFAEQSICFRVRTMAMAVGEAAIAKWKETGLLKTSVLNPLLATVEKGLVLRKLGRLKEEDRQALRGVLDDILGE